MKNILVLVGSLRRESINRKLAVALEKLVAGDLAFTYADMNLPLYNDDLWADPPASVVALKAAIAAADGILLVTPEYNRSIPAVMKNAIDWASRPMGQNAWKGKPVAMTGASPGSQGTAVSQSQLRSSMLILDAIVIGSEVYITFKPDLIDADGAIANEGTAKFLKGFLDRFNGWIGMVDHGAPKP